MYAIIETGGKQYKATVGETIDVELLKADVGQMVELDQVLMVADEDQVRVGRPVLEDARVSATVVEHGRGRKVIVFKYRPKQRYRRKTGHRQGYTRLRIDVIKAYSVGPRDFNRWRTKKAAAAIAITAIAVPRGWE